MTTLVGIAVAATPFLLIIGLLRLADYFTARRMASVVRQIQLTDAIHRELGAAAAPTVERRLRGGWLVTMAVPLDRPGTVAALLRITHGAFGPAAGGKPVEIVLTSAARTGRSEISPSRPAGQRPAAPLAPAFR